MEELNKRVVQQRDDGNWEVRKPGASRASAVTPTQVSAIGRARTILSNDGGGELQGHYRPWQRPTVFKGMTAVHVRGVRQLI